MARIAFWYKLDPWKLSLSQRQGLYLNIPAVRAEGTLYDIASNNPTSETVFSLVRDAAASKQEADRTIMAIAAKQLEQKLKGESS